MSLKRKVEVGRVGVVKEGGRRWTLYRNENTVTPTIINVRKDVGVGHGR